MNPHYPLVALRALHRCEYCQAPEVMFNFPFEVEHIIPISEGGEDRESNFALSCRSCNLFKATHIKAMDPQTKMVVELFDPRREIWHLHFDVNPATGEITGKTPSGRATALRLNMNSNAQISARHQWMRLGLYP